MWSISSSSGRTSISGPKMACVVRRRSTKPSARVSALGDGVLILKELVQRARRYAGARRDRVRGGGLEAHFREDLGSNVQDQLDALLTARLAAAKRAGGRGGLGHAAPCG